MKLETFSATVELTNKSELERVTFLAFYFQANKDQPEFTIPDISLILTSLGFAKPNPSRLKSNIEKSKSFIKGTRPNSFRLSAKKLAALRAELPNISESEEIISDDSLIPEILFSETKRQYLIKSAQQINSAYEHNLFDACALMMRRLLEILLIHCFEHKKIEDQIKDEDGNYQNLKTLINKAISKPEIKLSQEAKKEIDKFRELGNLSAHRVRYNCRRNDIQPFRIEYRAIVEELLYESGLLDKSK
ncbi:hypothetical protein PHLH8_42810 [Pseudomonas sp. Pc102]|uniref:DUF4145 domain-containing protein n=1 Tax=Pseudomonas sp. Pc102 TaxID=2678261 RepID=UPI001BCC0B90|nr:DUF4145 domain-containing protein [Pseudomonas sp. Pc102]BBP84639.1 hypothetical protein PHLH8_42810 [Pseudomonas sp. Pc102]